MAIRWRTKSINQFIISTASSIWSWPVWLAVIRHRCIVWGLWCAKTAAVTRCQDGIGSCQSLTALATELIRSVRPWKIGLPSKFSQSESSFLQMTIISAIRCTFNSQRNNQIHRVIYALLPNWKFMRQNVFFPHSSCKRGKPIIWWRWQFTITFSFRRLPYAKSRRQFRMRTAQRHGNYRKSRSGIFAVFHEIARHRNALNCFFRPENEENACRRKFPSAINPVLEHCMNADASCIIHISKGKKIQNGMSPVPSSLSTRCWAVCANR